MSTALTSNKPYLIRALHDWMVDNQLTPHILVDAEHPSVQVPMEFVNAGKIVLDISPNACRGLILENDRFLFTARFSGITVQVSLHPGAVMAIYAKENGRGMEFDVEYDDNPPPVGSSASSNAGSATAGSSGTRSRPTLKIVR